jgi:hypothetical protein
MKLYKGEHEVEAEKDQVALFLADGWSKTPVVEEESTDLNELDEADDSDDLDASEESEGSEESEEKPAVKTGRSKLPKLKTK